MRVEIVYYVADCDFPYWWPHWSLISCFRMSCMVKILFVFLALVFVLCDAQVNFSPNWGKRSGLQDGPCKASTESLMYIYKLIQVTVKYFRILKQIIQAVYIHSFSSLSYDRSVASSKAISPQGAI
jgi:hypothetical protein